MASAQDIAAAVAGLAEGESEALATILTEMAAAPVVRSFSFAYNTPSLNQGVAVYTPAVDDVLLDGWISVTQPWNGTTPMGDFGTTMDDHGGFFGNTFGPLDMTIADQVSAVGTNQGLGNSSVRGGVAPRTLSLYMTLFEVINTITTSGSGLHGVPASPGPWAADGYGVAPYTFVEGDAVRVVVSSTGDNNGADPGATQGQATLYLLTATPLAV